MKGKRLPIYLLILSFISCHTHPTVDKEILEDILGCWRGEQIVNNVPRPAEMRLFSPRPDGSLAISVVYELGTRSRIWASDTDVTISGAPTVMGVILKNACGMEVGAFAESRLFRPLGISKYLWTSYPDGSVETDGGLALRPRDLAKIGQLYLNEGAWNGARIVSADWVRESTRERLRFGFGGFKEWGYGYNWMQTDYRARGRVVHSYFHSGDGGQLLSVFPELNMVVVFTAGNYGTNPNRTYDRIMEKHILPAASSF